MSTTGYKVATVLLLCGSCAVMTCAWYLHLKYKHWGMAKAIGFSWLVAGAEYCLMVPANRIGAQYAEMSPATLRGIAELAILTSFLLFNRLVLKQDVLWNHVFGFGTVFVGVLVVLSEPPYPGLNRVSSCIFGHEVLDCRAEELAQPIALVRRAFPPTTQGGKWALSYATKQFDGLDPSLGGYPTPLDVGYPFEYPAPFMGQPGAGSNRHCPLDAPASVNIGECPRVTTSGDDDPEGPGYIPPEVATAALVQAHNTCDVDLPSMFAHSCRLSPSGLLHLIRKVYPRDKYPDHSAYPAYSYPTPASFSFMADEHRRPSSMHTAHWCDADFSGWDDFCPYNSNGLYVHAHLIFAAVQQHLAHTHKPSCGKTWDDSHYPMTPDTSIAFPNMIKVSRNMTKPALPYEWPGPEGAKRKAVKHLFVTRLVMEPYGKQRKGVDVTLKG